MTSHKKGRDLPEKFFSKGWWCKTFKYTTPFFSQDGYLSYFFYETFPRHEQQLSTKWKNSMVCGIIFFTPQVFGPICLKTKFKIIDFSPCGQITFFFHYYRREIFFSLNLEKIREIEIHCTVLCYQVLVVEEEDLIVGSQMK